MVIRRILIVILAYIGSASCAQGAVPSYKSNRSSGNNLFICYAERHGTTTTTASEARKQHSYIENPTVGERETLYSQIVLKTSDGYEVEFTLENIDASGKKSARTQRIFFPFNQVTERSFLDESRIVGFYRTYSQLSIKDAC